MLLSFLGTLLSNLYYLILHVSHPGSFPPRLSPEEERRYLDRLQEGDREARNKLVEHNLRLVAHIIKKYYISANDQDDLISIGTIGLIKAINTFNRNKGVKLSCYASRCIENEILMFFRGNRRTAQDISISEPIDTDREGNALTLIDVITTEDRIVEELDLRMKIEKLKEYIENDLEERERTIIKLRFGLPSQRHLTQREVAERMGISRSYVSRIEKKALLSLRKCFEEEENGGKKEEQKEQRQPPKKRKPKTRKKPETRYF